MENFIMFKGDTFCINVEIEGLDGQELDNAEFTCKEEKSDEDYVFQESLSEGGIWKIDDTHYGVRVDPATTRQLEPNTYYYDLQIGLNGDIYTVLDGKLIVKQDVTEA